jgi:ornithine cyclodeaminase/alanine dehydrogenase-like protein (mu-crystallin family)
MNEAPYVYFIDNTVQHEVLDAVTCIEAIEKGYRAWGGGHAAINPKTELHVYGGNGYYNFGLIHGAVEPMGVPALRIKSDFHSQTGPTSYGDKHAGFEGKFCGLVLLFNTTNGLPMAILNDGHIQHMRVAAAAAVAAKCLARQDSERLSILGSGGMARSHAEALCAVRPIKTIDVYSPNQKHRETFAREIGGHLKVEVRVRARPEDAVKGSDIVACCTNSNRQAVLLGGWIEPGMHITTVHGAELEPAAAQRIDHSVKNQPVRDLQSHFSVAGKPPEGVVPRPQGWKPPSATDEMPLLSDVILGNAPGRTTGDQVTYFSNNEGTGVQFASAGAAVLERLAQRNFTGVAKVPLAWFLEDIRD